MSESNFFSDFTLVSASFRFSVDYNAPHCTLIPHGKLLETRTKSHESNFIESTYYFCRIFANPEKRTIKDAIYYPSENRATHSHFTPETISTDLIT